VPRQRLSHPIGLSLSEEVRAQLVGVPDHENRNERESEVQNRPQECIAGIRHGVLPGIRCLAGMLVLAATARFALDQFCCAAEQIADEPSFQGHDSSRSGMLESTRACTHK